MTGYLVLTARCTVGMVFLISTVTKLNGRAGFLAFLDWLRELTVVPEHWVVAVGVLMVTAEAVTLVLLPSPATYPAGLALAAVTMAFFAGAAAYIVRRGIAVPCRCFGAAVATPPMGRVEIARNLLLTLVATWAAAVAVLDPQPASPAPAIILALLLGGALGLVITHLDDLRRLFAP